jgi:hypothetical protein
MFLLYDILISVSDVGAAILAEVHADVQII